ncbi:sensor histidine kinase, partial [Falsiroseomonas sp. HW251]|uniref:sensor histidine kinase n=1 Tax=Falsiroseomonas sp. HW251 TaxID=3390998 RepID=UPI003D310C78
ALLVFAAFGIRYWLFGPTPVLPYLLFFPAIITSAVILDRGSGIFATLLSAALALYNFVEPIGTFQIADTETALSISLFIVIGLFIAILTEALHLAYVEVDEGRRATDEARRQAEEARDQAEASERDVHLLMDEFGHRVKNDLARVAAIIGLQAKGAPPDIAAALQAAADRVRVIARVHDRLTRRDGKVLVEAHNFLHDLLRDLRASISDLRPVGLFLMAGERHMLSVSRAGAVGLIANELITNALKHAFPGEREGTVRVSFRRDGHDFLLVVADDGIGLPDMPPDELQEDLARRGGMGRRLVRALAAQLGGRIETTRTSAAGGATHTLRFPVAQPGENGTPRG